MLLGRYLKPIALFFMTLLVSERIPTIKTIDPGPSGASQLFSSLSEFANEAKDNLVEIVTRPSDFFHGKENNQNPIAPKHPPQPPPPSPPSSLLEPPPEPLQPPEPTPMADVASHFWRLDGSKIILELNLERMPGFGAMRNVVVWVAYLFSGGFGVAGQSYWFHALVPAALGFFGGLGYGFVGWCRWCLSRREAPRAVEQAVIPKQAKRRAPANVYFESRLSQSYMMPLDFRRGPDLRRLGDSSPIVATKSEQAGEANATIDRIAKKEEDRDPLAVPPSLSDLSWYSPGSPLSPALLNGKGLGLLSYDGFQPKPKVSHPNDLPETLLESFSLVASPPRPRKPTLPQISDPWNNYTPDDREELS